MSSDVILDYFLSGILCEKVCRICLETGENLIPLSKVFEGEITLKDMLLSITSLQIDDNTTMPHNVCKICCENILNCYEFRIKCEDADCQLRQSLKLFCEEIDKMSHENDMSVIIVKQEADGERDMQEGNNIVEKVFKVEFDDYNSEHDLIAMDNDHLQLFLEKTTENTVQNSFKCEICYLRFEKLDDFNNHQTIHSTNLQHVCNFCFKTYKTIGSLKRHSVVHEKNKSFICDYCNKSFSYKKTLRHHIVRYHNNNNIFKCQICLEQFQFEFEFVNHLKMEHEEKFDRKDEITVMEKSFECSMCDCAFKNQDDLIKHRMSHPSGTKHMCRTCGRKYRTLGTLQYHMIRHSGIKNHLCTICGKRFYYKNVLKAHMVYHGRKQCSCPHCDKTYHTQYALQEHIRISHTEDKYNYMCEECGHMCTSWNNLAIHRRGHGTKTYCPHCGRGYKNVRYYKQHLREHQNEAVKINKFTCDYCGETKPLKSQIERHILSKHLLLRRYNCKDCGKAFHTKGGLTEHGAVHRKLKRASCNICQRKLVNKQALEIHLRLHTGLKPYVCMYCDEAFISTSRRMTHVKLKHTDVLHSVARSQIKTDFITKEQ